MHHAIRLACLWSFERLNENVGAVITVEEIEVASLTAFPPNVTFNI